MKILIAMFSLSCLMACGSGMDGTSSDISDHSVSDVDLAIEGSQTVDIVMGDAGTRSVMFPVVRVLYDFDKGDPSPYDRRIVMRRMGQ